MIALIVVLLACIAVLTGFTIALASVAAHERAKRRQLEQDVRVREALNEELRRRIVSRVYDRETA